MKTHKDGTVRTKDQGNLPPMGLLVIKNINELLVSQKFKDKEHEIKNYVDHSIQWPYVYEMRDDLWILNIIHT